MRTFIFAALLFSVLACSRDAEPIFKIETPTPDPLPVLCDTCKYPVVMVHGFLASGDTWTGFHQLFTTNGYKPNLLFAFDWNSLAQGANHVAALDAFINMVLAKTGAPKIRLIGHSAGGGLGYQYLADPARAAKVDGYVHVGSSKQPGAAGPGGSVATLNIWSPDDKIASGGDIPGATNAQIAGKDHYQVATSRESFAAVWQFFHNQPPPALDVSIENVVCVGGKVLFFGENTPLVGAKVEIWEVDPATGNRVKSVPFEVWTSDSLGFWGPTNVPGNTTFEFVAIPPGSGQRTIHYFREGFKHLNSLVYLRTIPPGFSPAGLILAGLPKKDGESVLNIFSASQAVVHGRDSLTVNSSVISTDQFANASKTAIAFFCYDDGDGMTELAPVGIFGGFSFLAGVDMFFPTTPPGTISLKMNDRRLNLRNVKSSEGVVVGVFD